MVGWVRGNKGNFCLIGQFLRLHNCPVWREISDWRNIWLLFNTMRMNTYLLTYLLKNLFNHAGHTQHICKNTMGW
jgi:hypothetical protein